MIRDIFVGANGSVLGALLVFIGQRGFRWTVLAKTRRAKESETELAKWIDGTVPQRQGITKAYLFAILKSLLLGNIAISVPGTFLVLDARALLASGRTLLLRLSPQPFHSPASISVSVRFSLRFAGAWERCYQARQLGYA